MSSYKWYMRIKENRCEGEFFVECTHKDTDEKLTSQKYKTLKEAKKQLMFFYKNQRFDDGKP